MKEEQQDVMKELLGDVIYAYTRSQAIADGELIDVTDTAKEAGVKFPTAITAAVWNEYVTVPEELKGQQDVMGRLWDILWMFAYAVRSRQITGEIGTFQVIIAKPDKGDWRSNEQIHEGSRTHRLVTLKTVCGPSDDGSPCITIMKPEED